jgi:hypothetical protein
MTVRKQQKKNNPTPENEGAQRDEVAHVRQSRQREISLS